MTSPARETAEVERMLWRAMVWLIPVAAIACGLGVTPTWAQGAAITLDGGTYHIGNGNFSGTTDRDIVAQNTVVGPKWSIAVMADRPILCSVRIQMLYGVGGSMPQDAESGFVMINNARVGTIRPNDNHRSWRSAQYSIGVPNTAAIVTIHASQWHGDYDDFVFREVILDYTPANARVWLAGEGQILQEGQQYGGSDYVGPNWGTRLDALRDGGALLWGPIWKAVRVGTQMLFIRSDGRAGVIIPLMYGVDPAVQTPSGACLVADSTARQWVQVQTPWCWGPAYGQQANDYVNPTPCTLGGWSVGFNAQGNGRWLVLTQADRRICLGSDGHITYYDTSNPAGHCFTQ